MAGRNIYLDNIGTADQSVIHSVASIVTNDSIATTPIKAAGGSAARPLNERLADVITVEDFGAVGDGTTDDTAAFQAAIDALPAGGGYIRLNADNYAVNTESLVFNDKGVMWEGKSRINGDLWRPLNGVNEIYNPALNRVMNYQPNGKLGDYIRWDFRRDATYSGGETGNPDTAMRVLTNVGEGVGSSGNKKAEWAFQARVDNSSPYANAVAVTGQSRRNAEGAVWSGHFNTIDYVIPTENATRSIEANIQGYGADVHNLRWIIDVVGHNVEQVYTGNDNIYCGVYINPNTADMKNGLVVKDHASSGKLLENGIKIETNTTQIRAESKTGTGVIKLGTLNNTGVAADYIALGKNSAGSDTLYSRVRTTIATNTAGAETAALSLMNLDAGILKEAIKIGGGNNPISIFIGGSLRQVSLGDVDSAGTGFRVLKVAN